MNRSRGLFMRKHRATSWLRSILPMRADVPAGSLADVVVRCYHCGRGLEVSAYAESASCPHCAGQLRLGDIQITKHHWGGALHTCGVVRVGPGARTVCSLVLASRGAVIEGRLDAMLIAGGPVIIGPDAVIRGGLRCPRLRVDAGAVLLGGPFQVPIDPLGSFDVGRASRCKPGRGPAAVIAELKSRPVSAFSDGPILPETHSAHQASGDPPVRVCVTRSASDDLR